MIYAVSGSASKISKNARLLDTMARDFPAYSIEKDELLLQLPLYKPELDSSNPPEVAKQWRSKIEEADAVLISTPEYLHNIPAVLKNGFEWLKSSGELYEKRVLPITFTPHTPRGEYAMNSMENSLLALKARIVAKLPLYQNELETEGNFFVFDQPTREMLETGLDMLLN